MENLVFLLFEKPVLHARKKTVSFFQNKTGPKVLSGYQKRRRNKFVRIFKPKHSPLISHQVLCIHFTRYKIENRLGRLAE